jgi:Cu/Ag efflux protein CusF
MFNLKIFHHRVPRMRSQIPRISSKLSFSALICLAMLPAGFSTGCSENDDGSAIVAPAVVVYDTRGVITQLPRADAPGSELMIHHEEIPDFADAEGKVVGMDVMVMPFPVADGLKLDGFSVGDKVAVRFAVNWDPEARGWEATNLEHLPAETELNLGSADEHNHSDHGHAHEDHHGHDH